MEGWIMGDIRTTTLGSIPFGVNSGRPSNPQPGQPYFNGQENRLEIYTQTTGWQNIVAETPGVVSISGNYIADNSSNTIVISGTNFAVGAGVFAVGNDGIEVEATTVTVNSIVQITAVFTGLLNAKEPYDIKVVNPSNLYGILPDALYVNQTPTWNTPAGSLGSFPSLQSMTTTVSATDPDGTSLSYSLASGSFPSGVTLNSSTGVISGTPASSNSTTTYNFSITASDGVNSSSRSFSFIVTPYQATAEILIVAGGGGGAYHSGSGANGGGGAGGLLYNAAYALAGGSYNVSVGAGGLGATSSDSSNFRGRTGSNSYFGSITAYGGGGGGAGGSGEAFYNGLPGGSGGGATAQNAPYVGGSATQTSQSGFTGYGNNGGNGFSDGGNNHQGGGGGGAGGVGGSGTSTAAGLGGVGRQYSVTGTATWYAAGGGGSTYNGNTIGGGGMVRVNDIGGAGTIGSTESQVNNPNIDAVSNTGSGGGSARFTTINRAGNGSNGVIVIAYPNNFPDLVLSGLTYDQPTRSGYKVYRITGGTGTVAF